MFTIHFIALAIVHGDGNGNGVLELVPIISFVTT